MKKYTREEKKFNIACMIAANEYHEGITPIEWLSLASGVHDVELTKEILKELKQEPMKLVWLQEIGWTKAKKVGKLQKGEIVKWNYGETSKVVDIKS